jgi:23S rRNA pseudouridine2605 synthase
MAPRRRTSGPRRGSSATSSARNKPPRKVDKKRFPARSSSARDAKRGVELVRLNKYLADQGVASRRACDELIAKGKVSIDGEIVTELGIKVDPYKQVVEIGGVNLKPENTERRYYVLHKPAGVVCTNERRETRPRAVDLVTDPNKGRIYTVGRLDEDSTGLIVLTSDGEFAERVSHPRYGVPKTYLVKVNGRILDEEVQRIREGVYLSDGRTAGARVVVLKRSPQQSSLEITIREGKNREVRRMLARVGAKVKSLQRVRVGPLTIRGLREGRWRHLSREEVEALLTASDPSAPGPMPPGRGLGRDAGSVDGDTSDEQEELDEPERPVARAVPQGARRGGFGARGGSTRGGSTRGGNTRGGNTRGGSTRGGSTRSGSARGAGSRGGSVRRGGPRRGGR